MERRELGGVPVSWVHFGVSIVGVEKSDDKQNKKKVVAGGV